MRRTQPTASAPRSSIRRLGLVTMPIAITIAMAVAAFATPAQAAPSDSPAPRPAAAAAADLGYDYNYSTGILWPQVALQTPQSIMAEVGAHFRSYFPFDSNCEVVPAVGGVCDLYSAGTVNPVRVIARTSTGFMFESLPGHAEGAGRWISFEFYKTGSVASEDIRLRATAGGPYTVAAALTIESGAAFSFWRSFAENVGAAYS